MTTTCLIGVAVASASCGDTLADGGAGGGDADELLLESNTQPCKSRGRTVTNAVNRNAGLLYMTKISQ